MIMTALVAALAAAVTAGVSVYAYNRGKQAGIAESAKRQGMFADTLIFSLASNVFSKPFNDTPMPKYKPSGDYKPDTPSDKTSE
jgi:hypothetical protein